jgi:hypothetical protein
LSPDNLVIVVVAAGGHGHSSTTVLCSSWFLRLFVGAVEVEDYVVVVAAAESDEAEGNLATNLFAKNSFVLAGMVNVGMLLLLMMEEEAAEDESHLLDVVGKLVRIKMAVPEAFSAEQQLTGMAFFPLKKFGSLINAVIKDEHDLKHYECTLFTNMVI